ncbi:SseB family protein [Microcella sp.]|uniref:SseB family protein n=1 Tax=Microcella sp. TaxID=1913979 RepID=UPI00391C8177
MPKKKSSKKSGGRPSGRPGGVSAPKMTRGMPPHRVPEDQQLAAALERQDTAAVAFALRNDYCIVPLLPGSGPEQIRVFRAEGAEKFMLLLFSSPERYVDMVPQEPAHRFLAYDGPTLRDFLEQNVDNLEAVVFDVAGPHSMQADPREVLAALQLGGE